MRPEAVDAMRRDRVPLTRLILRLTNWVGFDIPEFQRFDKNLA